MDKKESIILAQFSALINIMNRLSIVFFMYKPKTVFYYGSFLQKTSKLCVFFS